jgi:hypothetical protein
MNALLINDGYSSDAAAPAAGALAVATPAAPPAADAK